MQVFGWRWGKMKRKYSTWYRSCSDTKIRKKKKNTYLCKDKMSLVIVLGCTYIYTQILVTCLHWFKRNNRKILTERENEKHMSPMSPMCSYNHGGILGSGWFHEEFLSQELNVSHESRVVIDISNSAWPRLVL